VANRDFSITYGAVTVGTGTARELDGNLEVTRRHEEIEFGFSFVTTATTPALFVTEITTLEEAFRTPNQDLTITMGDKQTNANHYAFAQAAADAFDAQPEISKEGSPHDSALSRRYTVRIVMQLPADRLGTTDGQMGRRESRVVISYVDSRRRTVTISGTWTGVPAGSGDVDARDQYEAQIDTYSDAVLVGIQAPITRWELIEEPQVEIDDTKNVVVGKGKVLRFLRIYRELLFEQPGGTSTGSAFDDPDITNQVFRVTRTREGDAADANAISPQDRVEIFWQGTVNSAKTRDQLVSKWENSIRQFCINSAINLLQIQRPIVRLDAPEFDFDNNTIVARLNLNGIVSGQLIFGLVEVTDSMKTGAVVVPITSTGAFDAIAFLGPGERRRTIRKQFRLLSGFRGNPMPQDLPNDPPGGIITNIEISTSPFRPSHEEIRLGRSRIFNQVDRTELIEIRYFGSKTVNGQDVTKIDELLSTDEGGIIINPPGDDRPPDLPNFP